MFSTKLISRSVLCTWSKSCSMYVGMDLFFVCFFYLHDLVTIFVCPFKCFQVRSWVRRKRRKVLSREKRNFRRGQRRSTRFWWRHWKRRQWKRRRRRGNKRYLTSFHSFFKWLMLVTFIECYYWLIIITDLFPVFDWVECFKKIEKQLPTKLRPTW